MFFDYRLDCNSYSECCNHEYNRCEERVMTSKNNKKVVVPVVRKVDLDKIFGLNGKKGKVVLAVTN